MSTVGFSVLAARPYLQLAAWLEVISRLPTPNRSKHPTAHHGSQQRQQPTSFAFAVSAAYAITQSPRPPRWASSFVFAARTYLQLSDWLEVAASA